MHDRFIMLVVVIATACGKMIRPPMAPAHLPPDRSSPVINYTLLESDQKLDIDEGLGEFETTLPAGFMESPVPVIVTGQLMETTQGKQVYSFRGIHFGQDPSGDKRFKKVGMMTLAEGTGTLNASTYGSVCPQCNYKHHFISSSKEDCLVLNVYTNQKPTEETKATFPVMVYIHGGSFIRGDSSEYKPDYLLEKDVILVTIQYRLGTLGFFSLPTKDSPGNAGLWDQILALQWVQENIGYFGGDKTKVTIFGQDAGAVSVNYLLLFKTIPGVSGPLFSSAIMEGGSALDYVALNTNPSELGLAIAQTSECPVPNDPMSYDDVIKCMRDKDAEDLTLFLDNFIYQLLSRGHLGVTVALPVVQDEHSGINPEDILLKESPEHLMKDNDNVIDVPVIIGANKHEGTYYYQMLDSYYFKERNDRNLLINSDLISTILETTGISEDQSYGMAELIMADYFDIDIRVGLKEEDDGMIDFMGAFYTKSSVWRSANILAASPGRTSKTYFYSFDFESDASLFDTYFPNLSFPPHFDHGVCHGDELIYLFSLTNSSEFDDTQMLTRDRMTALWTNFAIHREPTPNITRDDWDTVLNIPNWEPLGLEEKYYLLIQDNCTMEEDYTKRFHIAVEDENPPHTTHKPSPTTPGPSQEAYDHMLHQKKAFEITMVTFLSIAGLNLILIAISYIRLYIYFRR